MRIAYITVRTPYGPGESFVIPEVRGLISSGMEVMVFPVLPQRKIWHESLCDLVESCHVISTFSFKIIWFALHCLANKPLTAIHAVYSVLKSSRSIKILLKNITIIPRSLAAATIFTKYGIDHIHAHWGARTATLALLVSKITSIPWSFTAHRWDIYENNLLNQKIESAAFVRCISRKGRDDIIAISGASREMASKVRVIHMGVSLPGGQCAPKSMGDRRLRIAVPANMLPVKGHRYLIEAITLLLEAGDIDVTCAFLGDGPLENGLRQQVNDAGLQSVITFPGRVAHDLLMEAYRHGKFNVVVLPSINTDDGQYEGIPVCLIEAMAHFLPVISTRTGSIPELVDEETGILVEEKNPYELAAALRLIANGGKKIEDMISAAYRRVTCEYESSSVVAQLIESFRRAS